MLILQIKTSRLLGPQHRKRWRLKHNSRNRNHSRNRGRRSPRKGHSCGRRRTPASRRLGASLLPSEVLTVNVNVTVLARVIGGQALSLKMRIGRASQSPAGQRATHPYSSITTSPTSYRFPFHDITTTDAVVDLASQTSPRSPRKSSSPSSSYIRNSPPASSASSPRSGAPTSPRGAKSPRSIYGKTTGACFIFFIVIFFCCCFSMLTPYCSRTWSSTSATAAAHALCQAALGEDRFLRRTRPRARKEARSTEPEEARAGVSVAALAADAAATTAALVN